MFCNNNYYKELGIGNSGAYGVLLDIIWVIYDKISCYTKEVLSFMWAANC